MLISCLQDGRLGKMRGAHMKSCAPLEPRNPDVLLGLALIAQRQGRNDEAGSTISRRWKSIPNAFAQASLTGMVARADPQAAETKSQNRSSRQQPAAYLYFGLGNVHAALGRWNEAQSAYSEAQRANRVQPRLCLQPRSEFGAHNQPRAALDYYQRALKLAQVKGGAGFDPTSHRVFGNSATPGATTETG